MNCISRCSAGISSDQSHISISVRRKLFCVLGPSYTRKNATGLLQPVAASGLIQEWYHSCIRPEAAKDCSVLMLSDCRFVSAVSVIFPTMARIGLPWSRITGTPNRCEKSNPVSCNWGPYSMYLLLYRRNGNLEEVLALANLELLQAIDRLEQFLRFFRVVC